MTAEGFLAALLMVTVVRVVSVSLLGLFAWLLDVMNEED